MGLVHIHECIHICLHKIFLLWNKTLFTPRLFHDNFRTAEITLVLKARLNQLLEADQGPFSHKVQSMIWILMSVLLISTEHGSFRRGQKLSKHMHIQTKNFKNRDAPESLNMLQQVQRYKICWSRLRYKEYWKDNKIKINCECNIWI